MTTPLDVVLARLDHPRRTGKGWAARCPAHKDKSPSLSITEAEGGKVLLHCFSGCPAGDVLAAIGLEWKDLFPESLSPDARRDYQRKAATEAKAEAELVIAMAQASPNLSPEDAAYLRQAKANARQAEATLAHLEAPEASEQEGLTLLRASDIQPEPISWLWDGWLARGKLAILAGNPGSGKTTLALGLAAVITTAGRWPDKSPCRERGSVFVWSGEDDPADTLVPRLKAAGADLSRVHFLGDIVKQGERRSFDPGKDVPHLAAKLEEVGDVRLIIIDPIVSAVTGDGHKANDVRRSLQPIVDYAMKHRCAVIGITHFSKGTGGRDPLERVTGSQAYGALARVVLVAAKEEGDAGNRVLARAKSNIGPDEGGVSYAVETCTLPGGIITSRVTWTGTMAGSARDILGTVESEGSRSATDEAMDFLRDLLAHGPVAVREAQEGADEAGISAKALRVARERLGVKSARSGFRGPVSWSLPPATPEASAPYLPTNPIVAQPQNVGMYGEGGQVWSDTAANDAPPAAPALAANDWEEGSL